MDAIDIYTRSVVQGRNTVLLTRQGEEKEKRGNKLGNPFYLLELDVACSPIEQIGVGG